MSSSLTKVFFVLPVVTCIFLSASSLVALILTLVGPLQFDYFVNLFGLIVKYGHLLGLLIVILFGLLV